MPFSVPLLFTVIFLGMTSLTTGECVGEILQSNSYGDENFDHSEELGGNDQIDKITEIEVFTDHYWGFEVSPCR